MVECAIRKYNIFNCYGVFSRHKHTAAAKLFVDRSDARKEFLPDPGPRLSLRFSG
jgi:hypothetical protein